MTLQFTKMEGLGNDYVYVDAERFPIADPAALAVRLSDRHKGVGADGLVLVGRSQAADFSMRIFNADGSEAEMCGNAARCVGRYVFDRGMTTKTDLTLETRAGIRRLRLRPGADVTVNMGPYKACALSVTVGRRRFDGYRVDVGNPHFVVFTDLPVEEFGPALECNEAFPDRTNVEFARFLDDTRIRMRVWERGSGVTMACGTGACATFAAALSAGLGLDRATIVMDGGSLEVGYDGGELLMTGPAEFVFDGTIQYTGQEK